MKKRTKLLLCLTVLFGLSLTAAACGPSFAQYSYTNPSFNEEDWRDLTTDEEVTLDGKADETFWAGKNAFTFNGDKSPEASMSVRTHFGDKGMYFFLSVKDNAVYWNPERTVYQNSSVELMIAPPETEKLSVNTVQARIGVSGYTEQWMGRRSANDYDFTRIYFPMMARVQVNGELNTSSCEGFDVEAFIPWESIGLSEQPEYIQVMPAFNHVGGLGSSDGRAYNIPKGMEYNNPATYYWFDDTGYTNYDPFEAADVVVDGRLDEWFNENGAAKYASVSLKNYDNDGRGWTSYAFLTDNGLNIAAEIKHKTNPTGQQDWFRNTNFEIRIGSRAYWVTANASTAQIAAKMITTDSENADSATRYTTTVEIFIPDNMFPSGMRGRDYVRAGWAFKADPETIQLTENKSDPWWFIPGHMPLSPADHFQIYADGVYLEAKGTPTGGSVTGDGYKGYSDGWDLTKDTGENPEVRNTGVGNQNLYFKNVSGTKYYVEADFTMNGVLDNDKLPKFGLIAGENSQNILNFFVDPTIEMTNKWMVAADRDANGDWIWPDGMKEIADMEYTNGKYVNLGVLRDGANFYFYVNGKLAGIRGNYRGLGANDASAPGFYTMNSDITVKGMKAVTDPEAVEAILAKSVYSLVPPTNTQIVQGGEMDLAGGKLVKQTATGNVDAIALSELPEGSITGYDTATVGTKKVTVTYLGAEFSFQIKVAAGVDRIEIKSAPTAPTRIGETLDLTGAKLTAVYTDNKQEDVDIESGMLGAYDKFKSGSQSVEVTYFGKKINMTVQFEGMIGDSQIADMSAGGHVDVSQDKGDNPKTSISNQQTGFADHWAFFSELYAENYLIESMVKVTDRLFTDNFPKFGLLAGQNDKYKLAFFFDPRPAKDNKQIVAVAYAEDGWRWGGSVADVASIDYSKAMKLTVVKKASAFYFFLDDVFLYTVNLPGLSGKAVAGFYSMSHGGEYSQYSFSTDAAAIDAKIASVKPQQKTLDGNLSDWTAEEKTNAVSVTDAGSGKQFHVYAKLGSDGLYIGGYAKHALLKSTDGTWWKNTNFEFFLNGDNQRWVTPYLLSNGLFAELRSEITGEAATKYTTTFEVFVPFKDIPAYDAAKGYVRLGVAFKTEGDGMEIGGRGNSDWWWEAGHEPGKADQQYYVTANGIFPTQPAA